MKTRLARATVAALAAAVVVLGWWVGRAEFLRFALERAMLASDGRLSVDQVDGSLFDGFRIGRLTWREAGDPARPGESLQLDLRGVRVGWQPMSLLRGELDVTELAAATIRVALPAGGKGDKPVALPASMALGFGLWLREVRVDRLELQASGEAPVTLEEIAAAMRYRSGALQLEHLRLRHEFGALRLRGTIGDAAPYPLQLAVQAAPQWRQVVLSGLVYGELEHLQARIAAALPAPPAGLPGSAGQRTTGLEEPGFLSASFELRPFEAQPLGPVSLQFRQIDPKQLGVDPGAEMRLEGSGGIELRLPNDGAELRANGDLQIVNALPGPLSGQRLPLEGLRAQLRWQAPRLEIDALALTLSAGGQIDASGSLDFGRQLTLAGVSIPQPSLAVQIAGLDLSQFVSDVAASRIAGSVRFDERNADLELADSLLGGVMMSARARVGEQSLTLERLRLQGVPGMEAATIELSGDLGLRAPYPARVQGSFTQLDPARIPITLERFGLLPAVRPTARIGKDEPPAWVDTLARLPGSLAGQLSVVAELIGPPDRPLRVGLQALSGTLVGLPVQATGRTSLIGARIDDSLLELSLGRTSVSAKGAFGRAEDALSLKLRATDLSQLASLIGDARLAGAVELVGTIRGSPDAPSLHVTASAKDLQLPGDLRIGSIALQAVVPALSQNATDSQLRIRLDARRLALGARDASRLQVAFDGSLGEHRFTIDASGQGLALALAGQGGYRERWSARIERLSTQGLLELRATSPMALTIGPQGAEFSGAAFSTGFSTLEIAQASWRDGQFSLDASALVERLGPLLATLRRLSQPAGREPQDAQAPTEIAELGMRIETRLVGTSLDDLSGLIALALIAPADVPAQGEVRLDLAQGVLAGRVDLRLPSLAFTNRLIGPEWQFDGSLRFAGDVAGTLAQPRLVGEIRGERLRLEQRAMGWRLGDGRLLGRFDGERLRIESLTMASLAKGGGSVQMRGEVEVATLQGDFAFNANRLVVPIGPGQRIVLSGDATTSSDRGRLRLQGQLKVDEGRIEMVGGDAPKLPADVVVKGAEASRTAPTKPDDQPLMIEADLKLALGDKLHVHGSGLDARLAGELALRGALPDAPLARGTVQVRDGTFTAYGRELQITRGRVIFNGPLDNPVLDIVALRREQAVEAGVTVSGTVLSPKIRLTSNPDVPDAEKLSWLVLGQGLEGAQGAAQIAALQAAASTLFGSNDGSMSGGLRSSLGLDVLTVRSAGSGGTGLAPRGFGESDPFPGQLGQAARAPAGAAGSASDNVIAVGKRLGSKLLLSYEQGLQGTWSLLRLQYDLTRRLSLRAQTGTQTAFDILMRYPFD